MNTAQPSDTLARQMKRKVCCSSNEVYGGSFHALGCGSMDAPGNKTMAIIQQSRTRFEKYIKRSNRAFADGFRQHLREVSDLLEAL